MRKISAASAIIGFALMVTDYNGGPWVGTFVGLALFVAGAATFLRGWKR